MDIYLYGVHILQYICTSVCSLPQCAAGSVLPGDGRHPEVKEEHCQIAEIQHMQQGRFHFLLGDPLVGKKVCVA